jgi:WD40 repeat protein
VVDVRPALSVPVLAAVAALVLGPAPVAFADEGPPVACPHNAVAIVSRCDTSLYRFDESGGIDQPFQIGITPDGRTAVTGGLSDAGGLRMTLAASDVATGVERWRFHWSAGPGLPAQGYRTALSPDGTIAVVTGEAAASNGAGQSVYQAATVAVDTATGQQLWVHHDPASRYGYRLAFAPDGHTLYVGGQQYTYETDAAHPQTRTGDDWVVSAVDVATGAQKWRADYATPNIVGNTGDYLDAMAVSPDGAALALAGRWSEDDITLSNGVHRGVMWSTQVVSTTDGQRRWNTTTKGGLGNDYPHVVAWSPDGRSVVTGGELQLSDVGNVNEGTVVAFEATSGVSRWQVTLPYGTGGSSVADLAVSRDGSAVLVTGENTSQATGADYLTRSLAIGTGAELWRATFLQTRGDTPEALAISPDGGTVYVAGATEQPANGWDATTVAYRVSDGTQRWVGNYSGPNTQDPEGEIMQSLAISADGRRLAVAMRSPGVTSNTDMAVVSYDTSADALGPAPQVPELPAAPLAVVSAVGVLALLSRRRRRGALVEDGSA